MRLCAAAARLQSRVAIARRDRAGDPDPTGDRVKLVRAALVELPYIEGFFWECAPSRTLLPSFISPFGLPRSFPSLFQKPRTEEQNKRFGNVRGKRNFLVPSHYDFCVFNARVTGPRRHG